jgi:hypothetical protein
MHKYHLVLKDSERDVYADGYYVESTGALTFVGVGGDKSITYAPGTWEMVEQERKDDKG